MPTRTVWYTLSALLTLRNLRRSLVAVPPLSSISCTQISDDGMFEGHSRMPPAAWRLIVVWITLWRSVTRSHAPTMTLPGFFGSSITILPVSYSCHSFDTSSRSLLFEGIFVPLSERWRRRAWARLPDTSLHIAIAPPGRVRRGQ